MLLFTLIDTVFHSIKAAYMQYNQLGLLVIPFPCHVCHGMKPCYEPTNVLYPFHKEDKCLSKTIGRWTPAKQYLFSPQKALQ